MNARIVVLGAEAQAAVSLASAYPDKAVLFVSDRQILDGADLPNVTMRSAGPADVGAIIADDDVVVPLSARWITLEKGYPLSAVFERLVSKLPGRMLPLSSAPARQGSWIVKGDRWHRPDAPLVGTAEELDDVTDPHGCGIVYQPHCNAIGTTMVVGRRGAGTQLGCMRVLDERFFWDDILQAVETVEAADIVTASLEVLDVLEHRGFFTMNWLLTPEGPRLSSFRPVPKAVFQIYRRGGIDLLADGTGARVARAGLRTVAMPTYGSYARLGQ